MTPPEDVSDEQLDAMVREAVARTPVPAEFLARDRVGWCLAEAGRRRATPAPPRRAPSWKRTAVLALAAAALVAVVLLPRRKPSGPDHPEYAMTTRVAQDVSVPRGGDVRGDAGDAVFSGDPFTHRTEAVTRWKAGDVWLVSSGKEVRLYGLRPDGPDRLVGSVKAWFGEVPGAEFEFFAVVLTDAGPTPLPGGWLTPDERADLQARGTPGVDDPAALAVLRPALDRLRIPGGFEVHVRCYRHLPDARPADPGRPREDRR